MKKQSLYFVIPIIAIAGCLLWRQYPGTQVAVLAHNGAVVTRSYEPIDPLPFSVDLDERKVALGHKLFHDSQLSRDNSISCASCHSLDKGGTDHLPKSIGISGQVGDVNAPTVFNATYNFKQFWDGRADTLEDQIEGPVHNLKEMGSNWVHIIPKLKQSSDYVTMFAASYPDGIRTQNIKDAIATFERSLITPNSRFDQFLLGDEKALSTEAQNGYRLFKEYGCVSCHQGINIGGNLFEKFGVMENKNGGSKNKADLGRYNVTGLEVDRYVFKVPSLRNVELTAPYFHDGSAKTLEEAVNKMAIVQLARTLTPNETRDVVSFLDALTGEYRSSSR
jgi:cytochrome c peroxidase